MHGYSDTFSSHHTYCMYMNRLCSTHVTNLVDPGAARFLASQMKLLCGYPISCHISGSPANATISFLPQILPSLNFQKITKYSWQYNTLWYMVPHLQEHFLFYSLLFQGKGFMKDRWKNMCALYLETVFTPVFFSWCAQYSQQKFL